MTPNLQIVLRWSLRLAPWLILAPFALAILWVCLGLSALTAERHVQNVRLSFFPRQEPQDPNVVVVAVTDRTLDQFSSRSPVDRALLASLLKAIQRDGARAVGLDLVLDHPTDVAKDDGLRSAIRYYKIPLVVAYLDRDDGSDDREIAFENSMVPVGDRARGYSLSDPDGNAAWLAGKTDRAGALVTYSLTGLLARKLGVNLPSTPVPIAWRISDDSDARAFAEYEARLVPLLPPSFLRNKIVLVGLDVPLSDRHRTPFWSTANWREPQPAGVFIQAQAIATVVENRTPPTWSGATLGVVTAAAAIVGAILFLIPISLWWRVTALWAVIAVFWVAGFALWHAVGIMLPLVIPTLALLSVAILTTLCRDRWGPVKIGHR